MEGSQTFEGNQVKIHSMKVSKMKFLKSKPWPILNQKKSQKESFNLKLSLSHSTRKEKITLKMKPIQFNKVQMFQK